MAEHTCPGCGNVLPGELGQHADNLVTGMVACPNCGTSVSLRDEGVDALSDEYPRADAAPPGHTEGTESFSGSETVSGLVAELEDKPTDS